MDAIEGRLFAIIREIMEAEGFGAGNAQLIWSGARLQEDLGFDSLALAVLTVKIEDSFGVDVFEEGLVHTVGEVEKRIERGDEKSS